MGIHKNKTEFIGNITIDPEMKYFESGKVLTKFSIAINEYQGKDKPEKVTFIPCEAWAYTAEYIGEYAKKGSLVQVEGSLRIEKYKTADGTEGKKIYVAVKDFRLLKNKNQ